MLKLITEHTNFGANLELRTMKSGRFRLQTIHYMGTTFVCERGYLPHDYACAVVNIVFKEISIKFWST